MRLGIPAYELMDRMSTAELLDWFEYDQMYYDESWIQTQYVCSRIDASIPLGKNQKRPDPKVYLPRVKPEKKTPEQIRNHWLRQLGMAVPEKYGK